MWGKLSKRYNRCSGGEMFSSSRWTVASPWSPKKKSTSRPTGSRPVKQTTRKPPKQLQRSLQLKPNWTWSEAELTKHHVNSWPLQSIGMNNMRNALRSLLWLEQWCRTWFHNIRCFTPHMHIKKKNRNGYRYVSYMSSCNMSQNMKTKVKINVYHMSQIWCYLYSKRLSVIISLTGS